MSSIRFLTYRNSNGNGATSSKLFPDEKLYGFQEKRAYKRFMEVIAIRQASIYNIN